MWLHLSWVFGFTEDLQQLLVGEEEEPREAQSFGLEVRVQSLLDDLQISITSLEIGYYLLILSDVLYQ